MLAPCGSPDTWNLLCQALRGGEMLPGWGAPVSPGQSLKGQVTYFCCLLWSLGDLQHGAKQIIMEEFFSAHKAACKVSIDLEISETWRESLQQIKKEGLHFISQSILSRLWLKESLRCLSRAERHSEGSEEKAEQKTSP